ncbi:MAG: response regulator [Bacteroidia bacterium]
MRKRILLVDDHQVVRNGLKYVFIEEYMDAEFGEAENAKEAIKKIHEEPWNLVVLDINMPGRNGLDVLQQLKDEKIKTPVLVMSMHGEEQLAVRVLRLGASGYLSKEASRDEIIKVSHHILSGKKYVSENLAQIMADQIGYPANKRPHELLSEREYQIMVLLGKGHSVSKIAEILVICVSTVSTYRARILEKMNLKGNAEIMAYVLENKLI